MTLYYIYKHTSPSGKGYVGQTVDQSRRNYQHQSDNSPCVALANAIRKYGWDNFTHELLCICFDNEYADNVEKLLIFEHNTMYPNGYNLTSGGSERCVQSAASKQRRSDSMKRRYATDPDLIELRHTLS